jgi:hypothetical protein
LACEYRTTCWGATNDSEESKENKPSVRVRRSTASKRSRALRS